MYTFPFDLDGIRACRDLDRIYLGLRERDSIVHTFAESSERKPLSPNYSQTRLVS